MTASMSLTYQGVSQSVPFFIVGLTILDPFLSKFRRNSKRFGYIFTFVWLQEQFTWS